MRTAWGSPPGRSHQSFRRTSFRDGRLPSVVQGAMRRQRHKPDVSELYAVVVVLKHDGAGLALGFVIVDAGRTRYLLVVLHQDIVLPHGDAGVLDFLARIVIAGRSENDVIGLPL